MLSGTLKIGPDTRRKALEMLPGDKTAMEIDIRPMYDLPPLVKKKHESDYHRFCAFICPNCRYFEICGCRDHDQALSQEKGNGHAVCAECVKLVANPAYQTATDTGSPWNHACRNCEEVPAEVNFWVIHDLVSELTVRALYMEVLAQEQEDPDGNNKLTGEFIIDSVGFHCEECLTAAIPVVNGRFARLYNGNIISAEDAFQIQSMNPSSSSTDQSFGATMNGLRYNTEFKANSGELPDEYKDKVFYFDDFHFEHYNKSCKGAVKLVPIYLSKGETLYGSTSVINTPRLPLDRSQAVKFKRPDTWITNKQIEQLTQLQSYIGRDIPDTDEFSLTDINFPYPIWFHKGFVGQFGDAYLRDSDLEGGSSRQAAQFVSKYARVILNNLASYREFLPLWADDDIAWIDEVINLFDQALITSCDWERLQHLPDVCKLDIAREKRWLEMKRREKDALEKAKEATHNTGTSSDDNDDNDDTNETTTNEKGNQNDTSSKLTKTTKLDDAVHDFSPDDVETEDTFIDSDYELDDDDDGEPLPSLELNFTTEDYKRIHDASVSSDASTLHIPTRKERKLAHLARQHVQRLKELPIGKMMIFYGGYTRVHTGHVVVNMVTRVDQHNYSMAISNSGNGVDFHPTTLADLQKVKTKLTVRIDNIPDDRMLSLPFWLVYIRSMAYSSDDHQMEMLYKHLHTWLAGKPLMAAFNTPDAASAYRTPQRSGVCYYKCITESLRYLLAQRCISKYDAVHKAANTLPLRSVPYVEGQPTGCANPHLTMYREVDQYRANQFDESVITQRSEQGSGDDDDSKSDSDSNSDSDEHSSDKDNDDGMTAKSTKYMATYVHTTTTEANPLDPRQLAYHQWKQLSFAMRYAMLLDVNHDLFVNKYALYPSAARVSPLAILSSGELTLIRLAPKLVLHHLMKRVLRGDYSINVIDRVLHSVQQFELYFRGHWHSAPISAMHLITPQVQKEPVLSPSSSLSMVSPPPLHHAASIDYVTIDPSSLDLTPSSTHILPSYVDDDDDDDDGNNNGDGAAADAQPLPSNASNDLLCARILSRQNSIETILNAAVSSTPLLPPSPSPQASLESSELLATPTLSEFQTIPSGFLGVDYNRSTEEEDGEAPCINSELLTPVHGHVQSTSSHVDIEEITACAKNNEVSILPPQIDLEPQVHPHSALFAGYAGIHHATTTSVDDLIKTYGGDVKDTQKLEFPNLCQNRVQSVDGDDDEHVGKETIAEVFISNPDTLRYQKDTTGGSAPGVHDDDTTSTAEDSKPTPQTMPLIDSKASGISSAISILTKNQLFGLEYEKMHLNNPPEHIPLHLLEQLLTKRAAVIQRIQNLYRDVQELFLLQTTQGHTLALNELLHAIPYLPLPLTLRERGRNLLNPTSFRQIQNALTSEDSKEANKDLSNERLQELALDMSGKLTKSKDPEDENDQTNDNTKPSQGTNHLADAMSKKKDEGEHGGEEDANPTTTTTTTDNADETQQGDGDEDGEDTKTHTGPTPTTLEIERGLGELTGVVAGIAPSIDSTSSSGADKADSTTTSTTTAITTPAPSSTHVSIPTSTTASLDQRPVYPLCLWQDLPLTRYQQQFLTNVIRSLMAALATAVVSIDCASDEMHAQVLTTATAILAIADAIIRVRPTVGENPVGAVLEGGIPVSPPLSVGPLDMSLYKYPILSIDLCDSNGVSIDTMLGLLPVVSPVYNIVRANALSYLKERAARADASIFKIAPSPHWSQNLVNNDPSLQFVRDIASEAGLTIDRFSTKAGGDLSGECNEVEAVGRWYCSCTDFDSVGHAKLLTPMACNYPEFADYRDSVYAWKLLMLPQRIRRLSIPKKLYNEKASHMTWSHFSTGAGKTRLAVFMRVFRSLEPVLFMHPQDHTHPNPLADPSTPDYYLGASGGVSGGSDTSSTISQSLQVVYNPSNILSLAVPQPFSVEKTYQDTDNGATKAQNWSMANTVTGGTVTGGDAGGHTAQKATTVKQNPRNWLSIDELKSMAPFITHISNTTDFVWGGILDQQQGSDGVIELTTEGYKQVSSGDSTERTATAATKATTTSKAAPAAAQSSANSLCMSQVYLPNLLLYPQADLDPLHPAPYTETQVLMAGNLPSFNSFLTTEHSERLLSLLTQSSTRIPLVLAYFCRYVRSNWLQHQTLQKLLYYTLTIPSRFVSHIAYTMHQGSVVPVPEMLLGTVYGSLMHELLINSDNIVTPMIQMLQETLAMYLQSVSSSSSSHHQHHHKPQQQQQLITDSDDSSTSPLPRRASTVAVKPSEASKFPVFLCHSHRIPAENLSVVLYLTRLLVIIESYVIHASVRVQERLEVIDLSRSMATASPQKQRDSILTGACPVRIHSNLGTVSFPYTFTDVIPTPCNAYTPIGHRDGLVDQEPTSTLSQLDVEYHHLLSLRQHLQHQRQNIREVMIKTMLPFYLGSIQLFSSSQSSTGAVGGSQTVGDNTTGDSSHNTKESGSRSVHNSHQLLCLHSAVVSLFKNHPMSFTDVNSLDTTAACSPQQMVVLLCSILYLRIWSPDDTPTSSKTSSGTGGGASNASGQKEGKDGEDGDDATVSSQQTSHGGHPGLAGHDDGETVLFGIPLQDDVGDDDDADIKEDWSSCAYLPDEALSHTTFLRVPIDHWLREGFQHTLLGHSQQQQQQEGGESDEPLSISDYVLSIAKYSIHGDIYAGGAGTDDHSDVIQTPLSRALSSASSTPTSHLGEASGDTHRYTPIGVTRVDPLTGTLSTPITLPSYITMNHWSRQSNDYITDVSKFSLSSFTVSSFGSTISPLPSTITRFSTITHSQPHTMVLASTLFTMENVSHYKLIHSLDNVYYWNDPTPSDYLPHAPRAISKQEYAELTSSGGSATTSSDDDDDTDTTTTTNKQEEQSITVHRPSPETERRSNLVAVGIPLDLDTDTLPKEATSTNTNHNDDTTDTQPQDDEVVDPEAPYRSTIESVESVGVYYNGCYYTRRMGSFEFAEHETWAGFLINMTLYDNYSRLIDLNFSWFLPSKPISPDCQSVTAIGYDAVANSWKFIVAFKSTNIVQLFTFVEYGRCIYPLLIYSSDVGKSLSSFAHQLTSNLAVDSKIEGESASLLNTIYHLASRRSNFSKNCGGSTTPSIAYDGSVVVIREAHSLAHLARFYLDQSLDQLSISSGSPYITLPNDIVIHRHSILFPPVDSSEMFLPSFLLTGLIPDVLLMNFKFYLSLADGLIRGLPNHHKYQLRQQTRSAAQIDQELHFMVIIRLVDLDSSASANQTPSVGSVLNRLQSAISSHSALIYSIALDSCSHFPSPDAQPKLLVNPLAVVDPVVPSDKATSSTSSSPVKGDVYHYSTSNLHRLLSVISRLDDYSYTLIWTTPSESLDISPSLGFGSAHHHHDETTTSNVEDITEHTTDTNTTALVTTYKSSNSTIVHTPAFTPLSPLSADAIFINPSAPLILSHVQLIRLGLCFVVRHDASGMARLFNRDQPDLFVSDLRPKVRSFITMFNGIPHSILLQNSRHDLFILVPNCPVEHNQLTRSFPLDTTLMMKRNDPRWLSVCSTRYYLYRIHPSLTSIHLLPSGIGSSGGNSNTGSNLGSLFYLMLLRMLNRDYVTASDIFKVCQITGTDMNDEEKFMFKMLQTTLSDKHPDATALRLSIRMRFRSLSDIPSWEYSSIEKGKGNEAGMVYEMADEFLDYVSRAHHVSNACALSTATELELMSCVNSQVGKQTPYYLRSFYLSTKLGFSKNIHNNPNVYGDYATFLDNTIVESNYIPCYEVTFKDDYDDDTALLESTSPEAETQVNEKVSATITISRRHLALATEWAFFDQPNYPTQTQQRQSSVAITPPTGRFSDHPTPLAPAKDKATVPSKSETEKKDDDENEKNDGDDKDDDENDTNANEQKEKDTNAVDEDDGDQPTSTPTPTPDIIPTKDRLAIRVVSNNPVIQEFIKIASDDVFDIITHTPIDKIYERLSRHLNKPQQQPTTIDTQNEHDHHDHDHDHDHDHVISITDPYSPIHLVNEQGFSLLSPYRDIYMRGHAISPSLITTHTRTAPDACFQGHEFIHDFITRLIDRYIQALWNTTTNIPWQGTTIYERPKRSYMRGGRLAWLTNRILRDSIDGSTSRLGFMFLLDLFTGCRPIDTEWDDEAKRKEYSMMVKQRVSEGMERDPKWQLELIPTKTLQTLQNPPLAKLSYNDVIHSQSSHFAFILVFWQWMHASNMDTLRSITVHHFPFVFFSALYEATLIYSKLTDFIKHGVLTHTEFDSLSKAKLQSYIEELPSLTYFIFPFNRFRERLTKISPLHTKESPVYHYLCQISKFLHEYKPRSLVFKVDQTNTHHRPPFNVVKALNPTGDIPFNVPSAIPLERILHKRNRLLSRRYLALSSFSGCRTGIGFETMDDAPAPLLSTTAHELRTLGVMPLFDIAKSYVTLEQGQTKQSVISKEDNDYTMLKTMIGTLESHPSLNTSYAAEMLDRLRTDNEDFHTSMKTGNIVSLNFNHVIERVVDSNTCPSDNELTMMVVQLDKLLRDVMVLLPQDRHFCDAIQQWIVRKVNHIPTVSQRNIDGDLFNDHPALYRLLVSTKKTGLDGMVDSTSQQSPSNPCSPSGKTTTSSHWNTPASLIAARRELQDLDDSSKQGMRDVFRRFVSKHSTTTKVTTSVLAPCVNLIEAATYIQQQSVQRALPMMIKLLTPVFALMQKFSNDYEHLTAIVLDKHLHTQGGLSFIQHVRNLPLPPPSVGELLDMKRPEYSSLNNFMITDIVSLLLTLNIYGRSTKPRNPYLHIASEDVVVKPPAHPMKYPFTSTKQFLKDLNRLIFVDRSHDRGDGDDEESSLSCAHTSTSLSAVFKRYMASKKMYSVHLASRRRVRGMIKLVLKAKDDSDGLSTEEQAELLMIKSMAVSYYEAKHIGTTSFPSSSDDSDSSSPLPSSFDPSSLPENFHFTWLQVVHAHLQCQIRHLRQTLQTAKARIALLGDYLRRRATMIHLRNILIKVILDIAITRMTDILSAVQLGPAVEFDQLNRRVHLIRRYTGADSSLTLRDVLISYVDSKSVSDCNRSIIDLNPFYVDNEQVYAALTMYMLRTIRITQSYRILVQARSLCKAIGQWREVVSSFPSMAQGGHPLVASGVGSRRWVLSVREQFRSLATTLTEQRFYIDRIQVPRIVHPPGVVGTYTHGSDGDDDGDDGMEDHRMVFVIEPRLLLFEYEHSVMLRDHQSQLVRKLLSSTPEYDDGDVSSSTTTITADGQLSLPSLPLLRLKLDNSTHPIDKDVDCTVISSPASYLHLCDTLPQLSNPLIVTAMSELIRRRKSLWRPGVPRQFLITLTTLPSFLVNNQSPTDVRANMPTIRQTIVLSPGQLGYLITRNRFDAIVFYLTAGSPLLQPTGIPRKDIAEPYIYKPTDVWFEPRGFTKYTVAALKIRASIFPRLFHGRMPRYRCPELTPAAQSSVDQLIMGSGKSAVVSPLLSIGSASASGLVVNVVPASLVNMAMNINRSALTGMFNAPVYLLDFTRDLGGGLHIGIKTDPSDTSGVQCSATEYLTKARAMETAFNSNSILFTEVDANTIYFNKLKAKLAAQQKQKEQAEATSPKSPLSPSSNRNPHEKESSSIGGKLGAPPTTVDDIPAIIKHHATTLTQLHEELPPVPIAGWYNDLSHSYLDPIVAALRNTADNHGVVVTTDASVKSLFLKQIECVTTARKMFFSLINTPVPYSNETIGELYLGLSVPEPRPDIVEFFEDDISKLVQAKVEEGYHVDNHMACFQVLLKTLYQRYPYTCLQIDLLIYTSRVIGKIILLLRNSVAILDEVDTLLNPLKSELNFPIGERELLKPRLRWDMPIVLIHFIHLAFTLSSSSSTLTSHLSLSSSSSSSSMHTANGQLVQPSLSRQASLDLSSKYNLQTSVCHTILLSQTGQRLLAELSSIIARGCSDNSLITHPHLVLVDVEFYTRNMLPLLARMLYLWLHCAGIAFPDFDEPHYHEYLDENGVTVLLPCAIDNPILCYLITPVIQEDCAPGSVIKDNVHPTAQELLNLARNWLHTYLPHVISKIVRVHFGLLSMQYIAKHTDSSAPKSRLLSAVPYVGKDTPSPSSEFAHSDILAGLTLIAYTQQGLRLSDTITLVNRLKDLLSSELGPEHARPSSVLFSSWIDATHTHGTAGASGTGITLGALQIGDRLQIQSVHQLLRRHPPVVHYYMTNVVFTQILASPLKSLSMHGHDLASTFTRSVCFSGTPTKLLPPSLGDCRFQRLAQAEMSRTIASDDVATVRYLPHQWTIVDLLSMVARGHYNAFIDAGALVTGYSTAAVCALLLSLGLPHIDATVFLNQDDETMALMRKPVHGRHLVPLSECNVALEKRFVFYDHAHTVGVDIAHCVDAIALVTVGKDSTFRDVAQAVYRMRGIGKGQTIHLLIVHEIANLIMNTISSDTITVAGVDGEVVDHGDDDNDDGDNTNDLLIPTLSMQPSDASTIILENKDTSPTMAPTYITPSTIVQWLLIRGNTQEQKEVVQHANYVSTIQARLFSLSLIVQHCMYINPDDDIMPLPLVFAMEDLYKFINASAIFTKVHDNSITKGLDLVSTAFDIIQEQAGQIIPATVFLSSHYIKNADLEAFTITLLKGIHMAHCIIESITPRSTQTPVNWFVEDIDEEDENDTMQIGYDDDANNNGENNDDVNDDVNTLDLTDTQSDNKVLDDSTNGNGNDDDNDISVDAGADDQVKAAEMESEVQSDVQSSDATNEGEVVESARDSTDDSSTSKHQDQDDLSQQGEQPTTATTNDEQSAQPSQSSPTRIVHGVTGDGFTPIPGYTPKHNPVLTTLNHLDSECVHEQEVEIQQQTHSKNQDSDYTMIVGDRNYTPWAVSTSTLLSSHTLVAPGTGTTSGDGQQLDDHDQHRELNILLQSYCTSSSTDEVIPQTGCLHTSVKLLYMLYQYILSQRELGNMVSIKVVPHFEGTPHPLALLRQYNNFEKFVIHCLYSGISSSSSTTLGDVLSGKTSASSSAPSADKPTKTKNKGKSSGKSSSDLQSLAMVSNIYPLSTVSIASSQLLFPGTIHTTRAFHPTLPNNDQLRLRNTHVACEIHQFLGYTNYGEGEKLPNLAYIQGALSIDLRIEIQSILAILKSLAQQSHQQPHQQTQEESGTTGESSSSTSTSTSVTGIPRNLCISILTVSGLSKIIPYIPPTEFINEGDIERVFAKSIGSIHNNINYDNLDVASVNSSSSSSSSVSSKWHTRVLLLTLYEVASLRRVLLNTNLTARLQQPCIILIRDLYTNSVFHSWNNLSLLNPIYRQYTSAYDRVCKADDNHQTPSLPSISTTLLARSTWSNRWQGYACIETLRWYDGQTFFVPASSAAILAAMPDMSPSLKAKITKVFLTAHRRVRNVANHTPLEVILRTRSHVSIMLYHTILYSLYIGLLAHARKTYTATSPTNNTASTPSSAKLFALIDVASRGFVDEAALITAVNNYVPASTLTVDAHMASNLMQYIVPSKTSTMSFTLGDFAEWLGYMKERYPQHSIDY